MPLLVAVGSGFADPAWSQAIQGAEWVPIDPEATLYVEVPQGRIVVRLSEDLAQGHVTRLRTLARAGYFDGLEFYRVIEGFIAQGGEYDAPRPIPGAGPLQAEFDAPWSEDLAFVPLNDVDQFGEQSGLFIDRDSSTCARCLCRCGRLARAGRLGMGVSPPPVGFGHNSDCPDLGRMAPINYERAHSRAA